MSNFESTSPLRLFRSAGLASAVLLVSMVSAHAEPAVDKASVKRGAYLIATSGCGDCHTPMKMGANGPEPDMTRALSGHPEQLKMPPAPKLPAGPWVWIGSGSNTAFAGPWGVSYAANLTPDAATGLGQWTEQQFIAALKTGRHVGASRPILPPMPWPALSQMTDADLKSIFAYLRTVQPVNNRVPEPTPPVQAIHASTSKGPAG